MFPLTSYHLVVNERKEAFIYQRIPGSLFWLILLGLFIGGSFKYLLFHPYPLYLQIPLWALTIVLIIAACITIGATLVMLFDEPVFLKFRWRYTPKLAISTVAELLPKLTVKAYDKLPEDFFTVEGYTENVPCLITTVTANNNSHLRAFLKAEKDCKRKKARRLNAEREVDIRRRWQR